jgi:hypothetical protein
MPNTLNYSKEEVLDAIIDCTGKYNQVSVKLGCNRATAKVYVQKWPETLQAFHDERDATTDSAIFAIQRSINSGDWKAAAWWLSKREAKEFGDKLEVTGSVTHNINIIVKDKASQDEINKLMD